jgi:dTDP-4-dehydrorhamnose reductase
VSRPHNPTTSDRPLLLLGGSGMLGRAWRLLLDDLGEAYEAPPSQVCDLSRPSSVLTSVGDQYRAVVNCAAYTDVDGCESNEPRATAINGDGVGVLAQRCARLRIPLVHYSTDYVFDGSATSPYAIDSPRRPVNAYGRCKARGEALIESAGGEHVIIRTSWLYAPWGKNFVRTITRLAQERAELRVVNDQIGRPTSCESLVTASWRLLTSQARGTFHVCDDGTCSWFQLAREIVRLTGAAGRVLPCTTAEFPRPARRPAYSVLDLTHTIERLGPLPTWQQSLESTIARLEPVAL